MSTIHKITTAILAIKSDAQCSVSGNIDNIVWHDDNPTNISKSDIEAKMTEIETAETNEATAKATAQASGNTKLLALGLSQAEATALTGYTPE